MTSATSSCARRSRRAGRSTNGQGAHRAPAPARALLLPLRDGNAQQPRRALPDGAAGGLQPAGPARLLLVPELPARLVQRPRADGARGPRLRGQPRRLHLRRGLPLAQGRDRGARRPHRAVAGGRDPRGGLAGGLPRRSTSSTAPTRTCASCTRASRWSRPGTTTRRRTTTPAARADGGLPPAQRFSQQRRRAGYKAFFEHMPHFAQPRGRDRLYRALRFGRNVDLIMLDERQYRDNQPCNDAVAEPLPRVQRPAHAARRAGRRRSSRARSSGRPRPGS